MDSLQTNTTNYVMDSDRRCITMVICIAEKKGFRLYVAWEWKSMAEQGVFGFAKSRDLFLSITNEAVKETADYGFDIGGTGEERNVFPLLFQ